jgi:OOP family OmpA-OmpF porin
MKRLVITALFAASALYAGGKVIAPVAAPVVPIENVDISPWYAGIGLAWADFVKDPCSPTDPTCRYEDATYGIMARAGYDFNQYFGVEARGARTFWDEGPHGGVPLMHVGLFLKPQYPLAEQVNLYALGGYGYTKNMGSGNRLDYFDDDWGFSAGVGLEYDLSDREGDRVENAAYDREFDGYADQGKGWSLFVDYQRLLIKSDVPDMDMISAGIRYDF